MPRKPISPYKLAALPEWQQRDIQRREAKQQATLRRGTSLKPKPGSRPLQRVRKVGGKVIKRLAQRTGLAPSGKPLKLMGVRGKRLAPKDRQQETAVHKMRCICGCMDYREPQTGEVSRCHLESRRFESTRNADWNNLPGCLAINHWLDHEPGGLKCRADLLELARSKLRRLESEEVRPLLKLHGYYDWRLGAWRI